MEEKGGGGWKWGREKGGGGAQTKLQRAMFDSQDFSL